MLSSGGRFRAEQAPDTDITIPTAEVRGSEFIMRGGGGGVGWQVLTILYSIYNLFIFFC